MKLLLLAAGLFLSTINAAAQMGQWTIKLNNKQIVTTSKEDEKINCKKLRKKDWKKQGTLEINFIENEPDTWIRSFLFYDENDNELLRADSTNYSLISIEKFSNIYHGKKSLIIYTTISPIDPTIAIRMRRVHLYTFMLP